MKPVTIQVAKASGAAVLAALGLSCATAPVATARAVRSHAATAEARLEIFDRPFAGEYRTARMFDHDRPILDKDPNNYSLNACGQRVKGFNGHTGFDWPMPTGTPLLAVAAGRIVRAEEEPPLACLGRRRNGARVVEIETRPNATDIILASYGHLERIDVAVGETVRAGDVIGTSGNTGCSKGPHFIFRPHEFLKGARF